MTTDLHDQRREYHGTPLPAVVRDPWELWKEWFAQAQAEQRAGRLDEASAMVLATADDRGRPSARVLLCKAFGPEGFDFYSHAESRKGHDLAVNPQASMVFHWPSLNRQVRIEGEVIVRPAEQSAAYWHERPHASQVAGWVSHQSHPQTSRAELAEKFTEASVHFEGTPVPVPDGWRGYRLLPAAIEFWQGLESRLHDRLLLRRGSGESWACTRLDP